MSVRGDFFIGLHAKPRSHEKRFGYPPLTYDKFVHRRAPLNYPWEQKR